MNNQKAFTLIELLVVVLIIGILAAVAVPQYQFAVDKTRAMTYFQNAQAIIKAEQVYKMANGNYTSDFTTLDVDWTKTCGHITGSCYNELINCPGNFAFHIENNQCTALTDYMIVDSCTTASCASYTSQANRNFRLRLYFQDGAVKECLGYTTRGQKLCNYFTQHFSR